MAIDDAEDDNDDDDDDDDDDDGSGRFGRGWQPPAPRPTYMIVWMKLFKHTTHAIHEPWVTLDPHIANAIPAWW